MSQYIIKENNGRIYYEIEGKGEPVVFIHGFSLDRRMWSAQVPYFSRTHQVITYDLRGFGRSSVPQDIYAHHEDLYGLLSHLGIRSAHIVGLSLGGSVGIDFALLYQNAVKTLTIADSALSGYESRVDWNIPAKEKTVQEAKDAWLRHEVFDATRDRHDVMERLRTMVADYSGFHWFQSVKRTKPKPSALERLHEIAVPTTIMVGENDLPYFQDIARILAQGIPDSKLHIIPGAGHMANMENPVAFNTNVYNFITRKG
ncbi:MAG: alpha/beta hydrolase [bacterium]|nr:alpha/beta hydrolase [bacterium]